VQLYGSDREKRQSQIMSYLEKKFKPSQYFSTGVIDYHKLVKLAELMNKSTTLFGDFIVENTILPEELMNGKCVEKMTTNQFKQFSRIKYDKDKIIAGMLKDLDILGARLSGQVDQISQLVSDVALNEAEEDIVL